MYKLDQMINRFNHGCVSFERAIEALEERNISTYETELQSAARDVADALELALKIYLENFPKLDPDDRQKLNKHPQFHGLMTFMKKYADPPLGQKKGAQLYGYRQMRNEVTHLGAIPPGETVQEAIAEIRQFILSYFPEAIVQLKTNCEAKEIRKMTKEKQPENSETGYGVKFGNVEGGIHGSIIAGRDINSAAITVGQPLVPANEEPNVDGLKQLLLEIQQELTEIMTQSETLKEVSPAAPYMVQGAAQNMQDVTEIVKPQMKPETAKSVLQDLAYTITLLSGILTGVKSLAQKAGEVSQVVSPIVKPLESLLEKVRQAAAWVAQLW